MIHQSIKVDLRHMHGEQKVYIPSSEGSVRVEQIVPTRSPANLLIRGGKTEIFVLHVRQMKTRSEVLGKEGCDENVRTRSLGKSWNREDDMDDMVLQVHLVETRYPVYVKEAFNYLN